VPLRGARIDSTSWRVKNPGRHSGRFADSMRSMPASQGKGYDIKRWNAASDDWHTTNATVDLRVGGAFSSRMEAKDGSMGFDFTGT
jgi:Activator of Hsp90 ATPase homolog 1-like protein